MSNGEVEVSYEYSDFGETKTVGNTDFYNEICYTSGIYDGLSNLYYLNARYYNPSSTRFMTMDTYRGDLKDILRFIKKSYKKTIFFKKCISIKKHSFKVYE